MVRCSIGHLERMHLKENKSVITRYNSKFLSRNGVAGTFKFMRIIALRPFNISSYGKVYPAG